MNLLVAKSNSSHPSLKSLPGNSSGFSLMEIMVVLMIIGGLLVIALPRMNFSPTDGKKVFNEFSRTAKEVRNRARLYNSSYRLAFRLDKDNQAYWVEKSSQTTYIDKEALEKARQAEKDSFRKDEDKSAAPTGGFQPDSSVFKKEQTLPRGFRFVLVESGSRENSYSDGTAYIHFFPQGFIEPAILQIEDPKKNIWSLFFNTLTGQATIIPEAKLLKDLQQ